MIVSSYKYNIKKIVIKLVYNLFQSLNTGAPTDQNKQQLRNSVNFYSTISHKSIIIIKNK